MGNVGHFSEIIRHLSRKKPALTEVRLGEWEVTKPVVELDPDGKNLYCRYGHHYLHIYYDEGHPYNPYRISIDSGCVFAREQVFGTRYYTDVAPTERDVVECIRYRLRTDR